MPKKEYNTEWRAGKARTPAMKVQGEYGLFAPSYWDQGSKDKTQILLSNNSGICGRRGYQ